jgi:hypothetical protein
MGHRRGDLADARHRFWTVYSYVIAYRDQTRPLEITATVQGALGERELNADVYNPILDSLGDHQPKTIGEIERALSGTQFGLVAIYEAIMVLAGRGDLALVQDDAAQAAARVRTDKLNRWMFDKARSTDELGTLASPVTGGGIPVSRFHQLFLLARTQGRKKPEEAALFTWDLMAAQGQRVLKRGEPVETPEESVAALTEEAREFIDKRLPALQALQIA